MRRVLMLIESALIFAVACPIPLLIWGKNIEFYSVFFTIMANWITHCGFILLLVYPYKLFQNPCWTEMYIFRLKYSKSFEPDTKPFNKSNLEWFFVLKDLLSMLIVSLFVYGVINAGIVNNLIGIDNRPSVILFYIALWVLLTIALYKQGQKDADYANDPEMRDHNGFSHFCARCAATWAELKSYPSFLVFIASFFFSTKTQVKVLYPILADMQHEVEKARLTGKPLKASFEKFKGIVAFWSNVAVYLPFKFMAAVRKMFAR